MGRQIIDTGGPARTRYRALRAAFFTLVAIVCVIIIVVFVRERHSQPLTPTYQHARTGSGSGHTLPGRS